MEKSNMLCLQNELFQTSNGPISGVSVRDLRVRTKTNTGCNSIFSFFTKLLLILNGIIKNNSDKKLNEISEVVHLDTLDIII